MYKESFLDLDSNRINIVLEFCEKGRPVGWLDFISDSYNLH